MASKQGLVRHGNPRLFILNSSIAARKASTQPLSASKHMLGDCNKSSHKYIFPSMRQELQVVEQRWAKRVQLTHYLLDAPGLIATDVCIDQAVVFQRALCNPWHVASLAAGYGQLSMGLSACSQR